MSGNFYATAAAAVLAVHLVWLLFVIFGLLITRHRQWLTGVHLGSLLWGLAVEIGPWPCPLTTLEQYFLTRSGANAYSQPFLLHYLEKLVYPDISPAVLTMAGVGVCLVNIAMYVRRAQLTLRTKQ